MRFGDRLGFLIWLRHLKEGRPASYEEIGRGVKRSGVTVASWLKAATFPDKRGLDAALSHYFGADPDWIAEGKGDPPQPELWVVWQKISALRHAAATHEDALTAVKDERRKHG